MEVLSTMNQAESSETSQRLFDAFRTDHAVLGRALHALGTSLAGCDAQQAREAAHRVDREAGPHLGFEEANFYPALAPWLDSDEVDTMYREHADLKGLLQDILSMDERALSDLSRRETLIDRVRAMEVHVSDCGELFGVMGGLDEPAQRQLLEQLESWRKRAPRVQELPEFQSPAG